ncbi:hypothetical protein E2562_025891 [Oryza meyeriana var. granulata]|uniref:Uncharacterized protein n=1 Tax=Oryza meyeriana var. granulata TaxID=110450 RepID=A0A6G1CH37_9ORYZ|nr:hypothetical protein E2562_025891 [Oryza meyeriana var. granulata]
MKGLVLSDSKTGHRQAGPASSQVVAEGAAQASATEAGLGVNRVAGGGPLAAGAPSRRQVQTAKTEQAVAGSPPWRVAAAAVTSGGILGA